MKNWKDVRQAILDDCERIWFREPTEVRMNKLGIFPGGAGTDGQVLGNLFFLVGDTQAMGWGTVEPAMYAMIDNDKFDLEHCKIMFEYLTEGNCSLMGTEMPPNCPAPWFNMKKLWDLYQDIVASFPTIENKKDFKDLIWVWECYVNRWHWWYNNVFPWEVGKNMPRFDLDILNDYAGYLGGKVVKQ